MVDKVNQCGVGCTPNLELAQVNLVKRIFCVVVKFEVALWARDYAHALFPIGHLQKPEVRRIASELGLATAERKDSQGICFVGKVDLPVFLQQKLKAQNGDIIEIPKEYYCSLPNVGADDLEAMAKPLIYSSNNGFVVGKHEVEI